MTFSDDTWTLSINQAMISYPGVVRRSSSIHHSSCESEHQLSIESYVAVFMKINLVSRYIDEMEGFFDLFARQEGFTSARECFDVVQKAVSDDGAKQAVYMAKLQETIVKVPHSAPYDFTP
jgi:hypothetical protein